MPKNDTISALSRAFLPQLVEAFLAKYERETEPGSVPAWTATGLGKAALSDPTAVFYIRRGRKLGDARADKILAVIDRVRPGFRVKFIKQYAVGHFHAE